MGIHALIKLKDLLTVLINSQPYHDYAKDKKFPQFTKH